LKVDPKDPMNSQEHLQAVSALSRLTNDSAKMGMDLLGVNREANKPKNDPVPLALTQDDADG
jgi:hypothetical protein